MDKQLEDLVRNWLKCQWATKSPSEIYAFFHDLSSIPPGHNFTLILQNPSMDNYFLCMLMPTTNGQKFSSCVTSHLRKPFWNYSKSLTDLEYQRLSTMPSLQQNFQIFAKHNNIQYVHIPPFHSQSNGQVEHFIDTLKTQRGGNYNRNPRNIPSKLQSHTKP